jgi:hypothetical protein
MSMRKIKLPWQLFVLFTLPVVVACNPLPGTFEQTDEQLEIYPDYTSVIIPPNIAPMNFLIKNKGDAFIAQISNSRNRSITVRSSNSSIEIPLQPWRKLLNEDRGGTLTISVFRNTGKNHWEKLVAVRNEIATEEIDYRFQKNTPGKYTVEKYGHLPALS